MENQGRAKANQDLRSFLIASLVSCDHHEELSQGQKLLAEILQIRSQGLGVKWAFETFGG